MERERLQGQAVIDYEADIYDACARAVLADYPDCLTSAVNVSAPASFPACSIVEADSSVDGSRSDSGGIENAALVSYDVKVYSNLRTGARKQAKKILELVDAKMSSMNFRRTYRDQGSMSSDASVYQITARYIAGIDANGKVYRR